jgi:hypothetical protein
MLCFLALSSGLALSAQPAEPAEPDVRALLEKYVSARGGAQAWKEVRTMGWAGRVESPGGATAELPFLMLLQRPNATRFEIVGKDQRSIRIFNGYQGWKVRPGSETGLDVQAYTDDEVAAARDSGGLDGPLSDCEAKGIQAAMEGADSVEGHRAWRLRVTLPSGQVQRHWIDAESYLELRYDRVSRSAAGQSGVVSVYYRNYRSIEGLKLPLLIETQIGNGPVVTRMIIEKVAINPTLDAASFTGPIAKTSHGGVIIDTSKPPPGAMPPGR